VNLVRSCLVYENWSSLFLSFVQIFVNWKWLIRPKKSQAFFVPDGDWPEAHISTLNSVQRIAIMAAFQNASFTSPLAQASFAKFPRPSVLDEVFSTITGLSGWTIAFTVFLGLVLYDQCKEILDMFL
jgi:hypothetical protein